jgi:hypothetical protein
MSYATAPPWQTGGQPITPQSNFGPNGSQPYSHPQYPSQPDDLSNAMSSMSIGAAPGSSVTYPQPNSYGPPAQYHNVPAPPQQQYSPSPIQSASYMNQMPLSGQPGPQNASVPVQPQQFNSYNQPQTQQPANHSSSSPTNNYATPPLAQHPGYAQNPQPTDTTNQQTAPNISTPDPSYGYSAPPMTTTSPALASSGPPVSHQVTTTPPYSSNPSAQSPPSYPPIQQGPTSSYGQHMQQTGSSNTNTPNQPALASAYQPQNNSPEPLNQYSNQPQASREAAPSYQGI